MIREMERLPGGAHVVRFDTFPHARNSFYVGLAADMVFYLTESPDGFNAMIRAAAVSVAGPEYALELARAYVETTRPMRHFGRLVNGAHDVPWLKARTAEARQRLTAAIDAVAAAVAPPAVEEHANGHVITAYVLYDKTIERRTLGVAADGVVSEIERVTIADDLPVPISR